MLSSLFYAFAAIYCLWHNETTPFGLSMELVCV